MKDPWAARLGALAGTILAGLGCGGGGDSGRGRDARDAGPMSEAIGGGTPSRPGPEDRGGVTLADLDTLGPHRMRIHPLTRLARGPEGDPQFACHVELRDEFGHVTKALGRLRIELYRPVPSSGDPASGSESQESVWDLDLRDPGENAEHFDDLVTRTYLVYLTGLPGWVEAWAAGDSSEPWLTLQATFSWVDRRGRERRLQSSYRMPR